MKRILEDLDVDRFIYEGHTVSREEFLEELEFWGNGCVFFIGGGFDPMRAAAIGSPDEAADDIMHWLLRVKADVYDFGQDEEGADVWGLAEELLDEARWEPIPERSES